MLRLSKTAYLCITLAAATAAGVPALGQSTSGGPSGSISGVLTGEDRKPVAGVAVAYTRSPLSDNPDIPQKGSAITDAAGRFSFGGMAAGAYILCTYADPRRGIVNACDWTTTPFTVTLAEGQTQSGLQMAATTGVRIELRIDDPGASLKAPELTTGTPLLVGAWDPKGFFHTAKILSRDARGHDYVIVAPAETRLKLHISGDRLTLRDDKGVVIPSRGAGVELDTGKGAPVRRVRFAVEKENAK